MGGLSQLSLNEIEIYFEKANLSQNQSKTLADDYQNSLWWGQICEWNDFEMLRQYMDAPVCDQWIISVMNCLLTALLASQTWWTGDVRFLSRTVQWVLTHVDNKRRLCCLSWFSFIYTLHAVLSVFHSELDRASGLLSGSCWRAKLWCFGGLPASPQQLLLIKISSSTASRRRSIPLTSPSRTANTMTSSSLACSSPDCTVFSLSHPNT